MWQTNICFCLLSLSRYSTNYKIMCHFAMVISGKKVTFFTLALPQTKVNSAEKKHDSHQNIQLSTQFIFKIRMPNIRWIRMVQLIAPNSTLSIFVLFLAASNVKRFPVCEIFSSRLVVMNVEQVAGGRQRRQPARHVRQGRQVGQVVHVVAHLALHLFDFR